jgi:hypothetical protein
MKAAIITICTIGLWLPCALSAAGPAPNVDGFINDPFWASQARTWTLYDPALPNDYARCYLGYDDQFLFFAADVYDGNVVGANRTPKSKAWEDDAVKLLLHLGDPGATRWTAETFSFTFSAMGGATWNRGPRPADADPNGEFGWPPASDSGMVWAVGLKAGTTPNVTGPRDAGYMVEARIPWTYFGIRPPFKPGSTIGLCLVNLNRPEMSMPGGKPLGLIAAARQLTPGNPSEWERVRMDWQGPIQTRGLVEPLPLWLGSNNPDFEDFKTADRDASGPWLDRSRWTARLNGMRSQNLNTLLLRHADPLRGLLAGAPQGKVPDTRPCDSAPAEFGRSGWFTAEEFPRHRDQFRWILTEAHKNGIDVYLLLDNSDTWSQAVPTTQPATQPNSQPDSDKAPGDRGESIRQAVAQLFRTYPELGGIAAGEGYNSPDRLNAIASGMPPALPAPPTSEPAGSSQPASSRPAASLSAVAARPSGPGLMVWTEGSSPAVISTLLAHRANVQLLHPLQGGQWIKPLVDTGLARFTEEVNQARSTPGSGSVSTVVLGSLRGATSYLFWADPQWARVLLQDVRDQGFDGFLLDAGPGHHDLGREAIADYAYNAGRQYSPQRWESRLRMLGVGEYAPQLLELLQQASAIMPEAHLVLHDPCGNYMPQFGMLLIDYLQMPAYNAAGPDDGLGDRGRLMPPLAPVWPSPIWNRDVAVIQDAVTRSAPPEAIAASDIAANLARHVDKCEVLLPSLRHLQPKDAEQVQLLNAVLDSLELNTAIGDHIRWKLEAAQAWAQYKARRGRTSDVLGALQKSVNAWSRAAEIADRLYPQPVTFWQTQCVSAPPWSLDQIRAARVPVRGGWRDQLRAFQRELELVQQVTSTEGSSGNLPLWDLVNAAPGEKRQTRFVIDFEKPDPRYRLGEGATPTNDRDSIIAGNVSLLLDTRSMSRGWREVFTTDVGLVPLVSLQKYQIMIAYRIIDPGQPDPADPVAEPFEIGVRPFDAYRPTGDHRYWTGPKGFLGTRVLQVPPAARDGNVLYIALRRPAAIVIDQIQIAQIAD